MKLPAAFEARMRAYFQQHPDLDEAAFFASFLLPPCRALRMNRLLVDPCDDEALLKRLGVDHPMRVPWCDSGYYIDKQPTGRDAFYHAGTYYFQEPSAMLPAVMLDAQPDERVLDLCAAPGGKATQIGAAMQNKGLLVANDISSKRCKALGRNLDLAGVTNAWITNEDPHRLAELLPCFFDRILVDAPCSGEGMFRKDQQAIGHWATYAPDNLSVLQTDIIKAADKLLRPGGRLVYSTCTFSREENEDIIHQFCRAHNNYAVDPIMCLADGLTMTPDGFFRIWPQSNLGDGHFCAVLKKAATTADLPSIFKGLALQALLPDIQLAIKNFILSVAQMPASDDILLSLDRLYLIGDQIYLAPSFIKSLMGLKTLRAGIFIGRVRKIATGYKWSPSYSLARALEVKQQRHVAFDDDNFQLTKYLKGETLLLDAKHADELDDGYLQICVDRYPLGWAKKQGRTLKNLYPASWRLYYED